MSLFFSMATLFPDLTILLFFVIPLKSKWLAWFDAALFLFGIGKGLAYTVMYGPFMLVMVIPPLVAMLNYLLFFWSDIAGFFTRTIGGPSTRPPARPSTSSRPPATPSSRRGISTSVLSAARPTPTTPTRSSATAPSATATTATAPSISTTMSI